MSPVAGGGSGSALESYSLNDARFRRFEGEALGTVNVFLLAGESEKRCQEAAQEGFDILSRLEASLSKFQPGSDVALLNGLGASRPVRIGRDLFELLRLSKEAWKLTEGAFDPTIGPLMRAWGLVQLEGRVPGEEEIRRLLAARGMDMVGLDAETRSAWFERPGVSVDLGAIGKGYAVDAVVEALRARGIEAGAVISGRSSVVTWGSPGGEDRWVFDVVHPEDAGESLAALSVLPGSISTSANTERRFFRGGREYGHLLDPRTGSPARNLRSVTIWTRNAMLGDVLSTALFVLGRVALEAGGAVERLLAAWTPSGLEPRATVLLARDDPGIWGGLRSECFPIGPEGFKLLSS